MTVIDRRSLFGEGAPPSPEVRKRTEPDDRRNGWSTVTMPNGSQVCIPQDARLWALAFSMTREWAEAWARERKEEV